ncbi:NAD(P)/FAD-dependent oxidoreductase [Salinispira pacifica]|uniref:Putative NAD(FAD)-utilizing dehydrogenase n=1 Tax=Salinispira pacifica TaxID=1307761 RepID=V5WLE1_9SPIO|nr:aminoacetone oxidase family FAD-binding enzyme [Salinispira pacifica]AHC16389.1 Putative NAD(FAD)-utilizing dehydrogenase [Salinispira pacifica]
MHYDILVIGGGPSGLMTAGRAAEYAAECGLPAPKICILEANPEPGRKLVISGGGRCNFTNVQTDMIALANCYGREGKALISPFRRFSPNDCISFFENQQVPVKVEAENRAFPRSDDSRSILEALLDYIRQGRVELKLETRAGAVYRDDTGFRIDCGSQTFHGTRIIAASGGFARKDTGSDGSVFPMLQALGHTVRTPDAILVPVEVKERRVSRLMGVSIQDCGISLYLEPPTGEAGKLLEKRRGKLLFTHFGLSGPGILNLSARLGELEQEYRDELSTGHTIRIELDMFPGRDEGELDRNVVKLLGAAPKKLAANILDPLYSRRYQEFLPSQLQSALEGRGGEFSRQNRRQLVHAMKRLSFHYKRRLSPDHAVVARGGIPVNEVDFRRMESKKVPGLYIIGDMLDINRPSGGYSLQLCWSTAWTAAESAINASRWQNTDR